MPYQAYAEDFFAYDQERALGYIKLKSARWRHQAVRVFVFCQPSDSTPSPLK